MVFEAVNRDISAIRPLMELYKSEIGEVPLKPVQLRALEGAAAEGSIRFFIAKDKEKPVAMCSVSRTFSTFDCAYSGVFEDFYILPEYRKTGLARALTGYVFHKCREMGISTLWVGCADCDKDLYRSLGFSLPLGNLLCWSKD